MYGKITVCRFYKGQYLFFIIIRTRQLFEKQFRVFMSIVQRQENSSEYVIPAVIKKHAGHNGPIGQSAQKIVTVVFKQGNEFV